MIKNNWYVNKIGLTQTNTKVTDIMQKKVAIESKLLEIINNIREDVKINYKQLDNKEFEITRNMKNFNSNCENSKKTFLKIIETYHTAHTESAKTFDLYLQNKGDNNV